MIIFLGETLLQEGTPHVFMADEPELSLHVDWQETLVSNILALNPSAQVFFATHSPDIVSVYRDGVIDMEALI
jgi:predicted ATP-dependent endonuclease of OLD family